MIHRPGESRIAPPVSSRVYLPAYRLLEGDILSGSKPHFDILPLVEILSQISPEGGHPVSLLMITSAPQHGILCSHFFQDQ